MCPSVLQLATPSKCDLKEDLSLVNFVVTEKDFEIEDLQVQLKEAQSLIKSLEGTFSSQLTHVHSLWSFVLKTC